jgi:hypothetical protein
MPGALGALAMLVVVVAGCAAPVASTTPVPTSSTAVPTASPTAPTLVPPTQAPSPRSPGPSSSPWTGSADTLAWHRLGVIPAARVNGVVGFDEGYVALEGSTGSVWFSADGASWKNVKLPFEGDRSEATDANGLLGRVIATNGRELLVVGGYSHTPCGLTEPDSTGGGPDCSISPIAWISDDGVAWRRAYTGHGKGELSEFVAAWPLAEGGWAAALSDWSGESLGGKMLWHSADGMSWAATVQVSPAGWEGYDRAPVGVESASGRYLLAASGWQPDTTLATTSDGASWSVLDGFPGRGAEVFVGTAPAGDRSTWVLAGRNGWDVDAGRAGAPTIWSSSDGTSWKSQKLPVGPPAVAEDPEDTVSVTAVTDLVLSDRGYVAVGAESREGGGARHETWVSDDGVAWTQLPQAERPQFDYGPRLVADGPAGVVGISGSRAAGEQVAWLLR